MKKIFTNGCFDILHVGHIRLFEFAKSLGDYLIVGINSDRSIRILKGKGRPIIYQEYRKEILESIKHIDEVIIFNQLNPYTLIKYLEPDILVKGEDWKKRNVIGANLVKEVKFFPQQQGVSSTNIVNKIKGK